MKKAGKQTISDGITITIRKPGKSRDLLTFEAELEKDMRECMRCRFFYGNSRQCIAEECVKKFQQKETDRNSGCAGCPYRQSENYCFPCMKKILEEKKEEDKENNDGQAY